MDFKDLLKVMVEHDGSDLFLTTGALDIILYVFGGIFIVTSITGFCLLYVPFGINTNK